MTDILYEVFFPDVEKDLRELKGGKNTFIHYTSVDAAVEILKRKEVWLRNTSYMNDSSEIKHGIECIEKSFKSAGGIKFLNTINEFDQNFSEKIINWVLDYKNNLKTAYVFCLTEHNPDDTLGKLSMWRGYGRNNGLALVLNKETVLNEGDSFPAMTLRVSYDTFENTSEKLQDLASRIDFQMQVLKQLPIEDIWRAITFWLKSYFMCTKHSGFGEELEWRIISSPEVFELLNMKDDEKYLKKEMVSIKGQPQTVYKIPLRNAPEVNMYGLEVSDVIQKIIIGPTCNPEELKKTFIDLLEKCGVKDAGNRIKISDIPIR